MFLDRILTFKLSNPHFSKFKKMLNLSLPREYSFAGVNVDPTQTEFEVFSSNFRSINEEEIIRIMANGEDVMKSVLLSKINRKQGNEAYVKHSFKQALEFYYMSLAFAPYGTLEYGQAIANRTAALFQLKRYEECLQDIKNIWGTMYPEQQYYKIYIRQSACYINIEKYSKAFECNVKARENITRFKETFTQTHFDKIERQINSIFAKIKPYDAVTNECYLAKPVVKDGENPNFLNASIVVDLKYNDVTGRYVTANQDIEKGDILFVEKPYNSVLVDELKYRYTYCSNCFTYNPASVPCDECIVHFYCSQNCKILAWNNGHKWECRGERKSILIPAIRFPLNVMFKAAIENFQTVVEDENVYGNKENNFAFVDRLVGNKNKMTNAKLRKFTKLSIWLVVYLKEYTDFFIWLHEQPHNCKKSLAELYDYIGGILLKLCTQLQCNGNEIVDVSLANLEQFDLELDFVGYGLYTSTSMVNHSCTPNALVSYHRNLKIIRATKSIKKDEEISVDYANFIKRVQVLEPTFFYDNYQFHASYPLDTFKRPWICQRCRGKAYKFGETQAKCSNCQQVFSILAYNHVEQILYASYYKAFSTGNPIHLDNVNTLLRTMYHPHHEEFINYYMMTNDFYIQKQDARMCLNTCKMFVQFCENNFNSDIEVFKLQAYLRLMNATAIYYGVMQQNQAPIIPDLENYFMETLNKTKDLLQFYLSPPNIKIYVRCFQDYLVIYN